MRSVQWKPAVLRLAILAAITAVTTSACALGAAGSAEEGMPAPRRQVMIEVENNNWADIVVYAVRHGMRTRLGTVTSMQRARLEVPAGLVASGADLYLLADPIGGGEPYLFPPLLVQNGQRVEMRLENNLRLSSVSVW